MLQTFGTAGWEPRLSKYLSAVKTLQRDDRKLTQAASRLAEKPFREVWDNPDDVIYDRL